MIGYSKGSRGLSVLLRVRGIFTTTTVSPSPSLRQCPSSYAFHARRNLPDKELRYLRTLIVRAAIHQSFGSELLRPCGQMTHPLNFLASSTRQSVYVDFLSSHRLVFLVNSHPGLFAAGRPKTTAPFPEVTGQFCRVP